MTVGARSCDGFGPQDQTYWISVDKHSRPASMQYVRGSLITAHRFRTLPPQTFNWAACIQSPDGRTPSEAREQMA